MKLDKGHLLEELGKIEPIDNADTYNADLRTLLLVLAGDERVIRKLTLQEIADLSNIAGDLINSYNEIMEYQFDCAKLVNYKSNLRRVL